MNMELYHKVTAWMLDHRNEFVADVKKIVDIKSVSDINSTLKPFGKGCRDVLDTMLELAKEKDFPTYNYDYYCGSMSLHMQEKNESTIGVWSHLDVVPEGNNWIYEPYNTIEKEGFLIGRGVQDNKSPAVAILYVFQCIKELQIPIRHNLKLYVGCSEECGMQDAEYFVAHYPSPDLSLIADCGFPVCYGEKGSADIVLTSQQEVSSNIISFSGGTVINTIPDFAEITLKKTEELSKSAAKLSKRFSVIESEESIKITAHGTSKHVAFPQGSVNAIHELTEALCQHNLVHGDDLQLISFLNVVNADFLGTKLGIACKDEITGDLICNGTLVSLKDRKICLEINIRYPIFCDYNTVFEKLQQSAQQQGYLVLQKHKLKPVYHSPENNIITTLTDCYNTIRVENAKPFTMSGATYARKLPNAMAFGMSLPDKGIVKSRLFLPEHGDYHQPDESISIDQILEAAGIYVMALVEVDKLEL
jgi:succinyl-diaminopimelate desuccinylase